MADDEAAEYKDRIKTSKKAMKNLCKDAAKFSGTINRLLEEAEGVEDVVGDDSVCKMVGQCEVLRDQMEDLLDELTLTQPESGKEKVVEKRFCNQPLALSKCS